MFFHPHEAVSGCAQHCGQTGLRVGWPLRVKPISGLVGEPGLEPGHLSEHDTKTSSSNCPAYLSIFP